MTPQEFINAYLPWAQGASAQTGIPADYILGVSAYETNWSASNQATGGNNNFFGMTQNTPGNPYATYTSPAASFQAYANNQNNSSYFGGLAASIFGAGGTPYQAASAVAGAGYATQNPGTYGSGVQSDTNLIDAALGGTGSPTTSNGGNTGESWLYNPIGAMTGNSSNPVTGTSTGPAASPQAIVGSAASSLLLPIGQWLEGGLSQVAFLVIGVILLAGGVYMFAVQQGIAPAPSEVVKGAGAALAV